MNFLNWWDEYGSRLAITKTEDVEEYARRVAAEAFAAGVENVQSDNERLREDIQILTKQRDHYMTETNQLLNKCHEYSKRIWKLLGYTECES